MTKTWLGFDLVKMEKERMEKKEVERELSSLLERTLSWEDELNSLLNVED